MLWLAKVTDVFPERGGVKVQFQDTTQAGWAGNDFVRVLCPRMGKSGGAYLWLPEVEDLGVVGMLPGGFYVWLGSIPFQEDDNQVDARPDIAYSRHQSGVVWQILQNGDFQLSHPAGARITLSQSGDALEDLQTSAKPNTKGNVASPTIEVTHPSGGSIKIDADGNATLDGFASIKFQGGSKRFVMEELVTEFNTHTHTSAAPSSPTSPPITPIDVMTVCSPDTFEGPMGA